MFDRHPFERIVRWRTVANVLSIGLVERMTAGHFGAPGRFKALEEVATFQAFALDVTGKR